MCVLYLRSAGQSGCMEGCAASNSGFSLLMIGLDWMKVESESRINLTKMFPTLDKYLKFELSLAMRGNAVMSTEKR